MEWIDFHVNKVYKAQPEKDGFALNSGERYTILIKGGSFFPKITVG
jgi:hypothetical protein